MNKLLPTLITIFIVVSCIAIYHFSFNTSNRKWAYVSSAKLLNEYSGMIDARKVYEVKANTWKANIDTLAANVQNEIKKHEKEFAGMSPKERQLSEELIKTKRKQLIDYQQAIQEKAQQEDMQMTSEVLKQANTFIENFGKKHGYEVIFGATESGNIVFAHEAYDITGTVIEEMNKAYTGGK